MATNNSVPQNQENSLVTRRQVLKALVVLPASALPTIPTQEATPSKWVVNQSWRNTYPEVESVRVANAARLKLWEVDAYPTLYPGSEPNPAHVANNRAALHQIIEELSEDDLEAVYRVARLFALFPDTQGKVQAEQLKDWPLGRGEVRLEGNEIIYLEAELA